MDLLIALIFAAGGLICHQRPERSFFLDGQQFPVCARCTGLYLSGALGILGWLALKMARRWTSAPDSSGPRETSRSRLRNSHGGFTCDRRSWRVGRLECHARVAGDPLRRERRRDRRGGRDKRPEVNSTRASRSVCVVSWLVPGAGHLMQGRRQKGLVFLIALPVMFAIGLALKGALPRFDFSDPLVGLAAVANLGMGIPYFIAKAMSLGTGRRDRRDLRVRQYLPDRVGTPQHAGRHRRVRRATRAQVMTSHLGLMLLFAFFVSLIFATIAKDTPAEQARLGVRMFAMFMAPRSSLAG